MIEKLEKKIIKIDLSTYEVLHFTFWFWLFFSFLTKYLGDEI